VAAHHLDARLDGRALAAAPVALARHRGRRGVGVDLAVALGVGVGGRVHDRVGGRCGRRCAQLLRPAPLRLGGRQRGVLAQPPAGARVVLVQLV
jgi:hypothetical protein